MRNSCRTKRRVLALVLCAALAVTIGDLANAQDATAQSPYVSKEDYLKLKAEHELLKQELEAIKAQLSQKSGANAPAPEAETLKARVDKLEKKQQQQQAENDQSLDEVDKNLKSLAQKAKAAIPGTTKLLIGGYSSGPFLTPSPGYRPFPAAPGTHLHSPRPRPDK